ncbi:Opi1-domain-containing protein [Nadsonia fulvescens var. elongata DSM 6958]|uniref:Opi1-domain-containing protein n=1 Tax=Nadsonia fulvescens var. elongata DSM 6958 TaxID=857566 RepID=A0A1E3PN86_9ASCO|nr:Opi1-domain-containing protein [Nadsonia fulvescens var. elongata DSM 6958]
MSSISPPVDTRLSIQSLTNPTIETGNSYNQNSIKDSAQANGINDRSTSSVSDSNSKTCPPLSDANWGSLRDSSHSRTMSYPSFTPTIRPFEQHSGKNEKEHLAAQALGSLSSSTAVISPTVTTAGNPSLSCGGGLVRHSLMNHTTPYSRGPYYSTYSHSHHDLTYSHRRSSSAGSDLNSLVVSSNSNSASPTPPPSIPSLSPSTIENVRMVSENSHNPRTKSSAFLYRVSKNPLVSKAVRVYNSGKSISAPRFKYGAEMVKRVIKTGYQGVDNDDNINNNIDEGIDGKNSANHVGLPPISSLDIPPRQQQRRRPLTRSAWNGVLVTATSLASLSEESRRRLRYCLHLLKLANNHLAATVQKLQDAIAEEQSKETARFIASQNVPQERGGLLNQPTESDDAETNFNSGTTSNSNKKISAILNLKADVINTIRKVVTVISAYAGNSLPEPARSHVKNYILRLPSQWASNFTLNSDNNSNTSTVGSQESSRVETPLSSMSAISSGATTPNILPSSYNDYENLKSPTRNSLGMGNENSTASQGRCRQDIEIGGRVLILANESLEMLGNVISVVDDTLQKAELWCDKLTRAKMRMSGRGSNISSASLNQLSQGNGYNQSDAHISTDKVINSAAASGVNTLAQDQNQIEWRQR